MKDVEKFKKKLFTKNKAKDIINKNYNPLKVNYKIIYERDGLYMKNEISKIAKRLSKIHNQKEGLMLQMMKKCNEMGYNMKNTEDVINQYYLIKK